MDRFPSDDDSGVRWGRKAFKEGVRARKQGRTIASNPYQSGVWAFKSWNAGWADQDMIESQEGVPDADVHLPG